MYKTISITVTGKVQGVFFRQSTREKAKDLRLKGYVQNMQDGSVNIIVTGNAEQLDQLIEWCHHGPPKAVVATVETKDLPLQEFSSFTIHH